MSRRSWVQAGARLGDMPSDRKVLAGDYRRSVHTRRAEAGHVLAAFRAVTASRTKPHRRAPADADQPGRTMIDPTPAQRGSGRVHGRTRYGRAREGAEIMRRAEQEDAEQPFDRQYLRRAREITDRHLAAVPS